MVNAPHVSDAEERSYCNDWISNLNTCLCYCCPAVGINHPSKVNRLAFIQGIRNLWTFIRTGVYKITPDEMVYPGVQSQYGNDLDAPIIQPSLSMELIEQDSPSSGHSVAIDATNHSTSNLKYSLKELSNLKFV